MLLVHLLLEKYLDIRAVLVFCPWRHSSFYISSVRTIFFPTLKGFYIKGFANSIVRYLH